MTLALAISIALAGCGPASEPASGTGGGAAVETQAGTGAFGRCWSSHDKSDRARTAVLVSRWSSAYPTSTIYLFNPLTGQTLCRRALEGALLVDPGQSPRDAFDPSWRYVALAPIQRVTPAVTLSQVIILDLQTGRRVSPRLPISVDPSAMVSWLMFPAGRERLWIMPNGGDHVMSVDPATGQAVEVDSGTVNAASYQDDWPDFDSQGRVVAPGDHFTTVRSLGRQYRLTVNAAGDVTYVSDGNLAISMRHASPGSGSTCYFGADGALWRIDKLDPATLDQTRYGTATFQGSPRCAMFGDDILVWRAVPDTAPGVTVIAARVRRDGTSTNLPPWPSDGDIVNLPAAEVESVGLPDGRPTVATRLTAT